MTLDALARPQERPRRRPRVSTALTYVSLVVASAVVLLPLLVIFLTSLKSYGRSPDGQGALALPDDWLNFSNYATAFTDGLEQVAVGEGRGVVGEVEPVVGQRQGALAVGDLPVGLQRGQEDHEQRQQHHGGGDDQ
ncbi:hypothetical protein SVIOM342S_05994 [Streptomyces violaceorubidus]